MATEEATKTTAKTVKGFLSFNIYIVLMLMSERVTYYNTKDFGRNVLSEEIKVDEVLVCYLFTTENVLNF